LMASHNEIAAVLLRIYNFLISIGYINHEDILLPDSEDHKFDVDYCKDVGMTESAIALVASIPWLINVNTV
jgi:hypothetical protein